MGDLGDRGQIVLNHGSWVPSGAPWWQPTSPLAPREGPLVRHRGQKADPCVRSQPEEIINLPLQRELITFLA